ncbi:MAG: hypothetical protein GY906_21960 [bacterium]|nr:hypothetical protein [bacterium]
MANGEKKGLSPLAWVAIGCGALTVLIAIVVVVLGFFAVNKAKDFAEEMEANPGLTVARGIVWANPEWEEVSADEDMGTITIRETSSGKEVTVDFDDIKEGAISFTTEEGSVTISGEEGDDGSVVSITGDEGSLTFGSTERGGENIPEWVPVYPGTEPSGGFFMERDDGTSGAFEVETSDSADEVVEFYRQQLSSAGFQIRVNTFSGDDGTENAMIIGDDQSNKRGVQVAVGREEGKTSVTVSYSIER